MKTLHPVCLTLLFTLVVLGAPGLRLTLSSDDPSPGPARSVAVTAPPILVADYQFRDNLNSSVGNAPALTQLGNNSFESVTIDDSTRRALSFDPNNGRSFRQPSR
jgi:hypothetical protein